MPKAERTRIQKHREVRVAIVKGMAMAKRRSAKPHAAFWILESILTAGFKLTRTPKKGGAQWMPSEHDETGDKSAPQDVQADTGSASIPN